ncbi:hypothetical protein ACJJI3_14775 [Microbulbifer sp. ZKSA004]|uniref:hypothetical protein n=1 Tax=Microbulbifer sp. ZKSA004 TaxID=3243389 RepID=UPI004039DF2B
MKKNFAIVSLALFVFTLLRFSFSGYVSFQFSNLMLFDQLLLVAGILGAFSFWFLILADFFDNTEIKYKFVWGFCLIFFSWVASLIYFFKYFLPKNNRNA